jgi:hypothetical protein
MIRTFRRLFSLCEWGNDNVLEWGGELGQMFRVQMDHLRTAPHIHCTDVTPTFFFLFSTSLLLEAVWHFPPKAAGQGFGQGTGDIIEYMAALQPSNHTQRHAWMDPDFLMTE